LAADDWIVVAAAVILIALTGIDVHSKSNFKDPIYNLGIVLLILPRWPCKWYVYHIQAARQRPRDFACKIVADVEVETGCENADYS
jgi:hypothetical protein